MLIVQSSWFSTNDRLLPHSEDSCPSHVFCLSLQPQGGEIVGLLAGGAGEEEVRMRREVEQGWRGEAELQGLIWESKEEDLA